MKKNVEVVVIGGGIIGCSIAYHLAKEKMDVALIESRQIAGKTTRAAAGMLGAHSEYDDAEVFYPFARQSQMAYAQLEEEIRELSGMDIGLVQGGILKLAYSETDKEAISSILPLPTVTWQEAEEVRKQVSNISTAILGAAYIKDDVQVLPAQACRGFSKSAQTLGASIYEYTEVLDIQHRGGSYLLKTTGGDVACKYVVVANGLWSGRFFSQLGIKHEVIPVKGQCLSVRNRGIPLKYTLFHDHSYIVPRNNGNLVIGATMEENEWDETPNLGGAEVLIAKAKTMLPGVTDLEIDSFWAGLRPKTFDNRPFIGQHPEQDGILFATGHFRNGILMAPATGQMIRDLILGRDVREEWVQAFKIDRQTPVFS